MTQIRTIALLIFILPVSFVGVKAFSLKNPIDHTFIKSKLDSTLEADSLYRINHVNYLLERSNFFLNKNMPDSVLLITTIIGNNTISDIPAEKLAEAFYYQGKAYRLKGLSELALRSYLTAVQTLKHTNEIGCRSELCQELATMYWQNGVPEKAIEKYLEAFEIEKNRNDHYQQQHILYKLIALYKENNDLKTAAYYQSAMLLPLLYIHDVDKAYSLMKELSSTYIQLHQYHEAATLEIQLLEAHRKSKNTIGQFETLYNLINIYYLSGNFEMVFGMYYKAFNSLYNGLEKNGQTTNVKLFKAGISSVQAKIFHEPWQNTDNLSNALLYYDSALTLFNDCDAYLLVAKTQLSMADVYFLLNDYKASNDYASMAIKNMDAKADFLELMYAYDLSARSYEKLDRYRQAYAAKNNYQIFKDSLHHLNERKLQELVDKYQNNANRINFQSMEQALIQQELDTLAYEIVKLDNESKDKEIELLLQEKVLIDYEIKTIELENQQAKDHIDLLQQQIESEHQQRTIDNLLTEKERQEIEITVSENQKQLIEQQLKFLEEEQKVRQLKLQQANTQRKLLIASVIVSLMILGMFVIGYVNIRKSRRDIKNKNILIEENNRKLKDLNEEKNKLIRIVAHDLRNPIASSLSMAEMIKTQNKSLPEDTNHSLDIIRRSLRRMHEMIGKILDIRAIDKERINLDMEGINIRQIISHIRELFNEKARLKNMNIDIELDDHYIFVDRNYFSQIIENILGNAIKFSEPGQTISITSQDHSESCIIIIKDQGPGFKTNEIPLLFKKFQTHSAQPTAGEKSSGLGLYIVKKYVDAMNGKVWVETEAGNGTTFFLEFEKAAINV